MRAAWLAIASAGLNGSRIPSPSPSTLSLPIKVLMFVLIGTGSYPLAMLGAIVATIPDVMYYAIMAGMLAQAFPPSVRYTGIAGTYALTGMIGGALPLILQSLLTGTGTIWTSIGFVAVCCLASLFGARALLTLSARRDAAEAEAAATGAESRQSRAGPVAGWSLSARSSHGTA